MLCALSSSNGRFLKGHPLTGDERLQVFLTNTLEPIHPEPNFLLPAIAEEAEAAQIVKDKPILVITGNPPYSAHSKNKGEWITAAIQPYKMVDGKHFGEKKHWLHDDYVKFIRFAQLKMDAVPEGVVGIITNHSWLDNPTFRGMRQSLMHSFEQIYILDLHGNAKKKEHALDGSMDENVFDIEQGVAVSLFIKKPGLERGVWRGELWGSRLVKYQAAAESSLHTFGWKKLEVEPPQYLFKSLSSDEAAQEYKSYWAVPDILPENTPGIITARDRFSIALSHVELEQRVSKLIDTKATDTDLRDAYKLDDTRGWSLSRARVALRDRPDWKDSIRPILQAPFDCRYVAYDIRLIDWGRWNFISRLSNNKLGLCLPRKIDIQKPWEHVFVADELISHHAVSMKEVNYIFPLTVDGHENVSSDFRKFIDTRYEHHYTPEENFGYIYAILHAPAYRTRYAEFLRIDFPRVPFPEASDDFEKLSKLGWALVQAHLLHETPRRSLADYPVKGDHTVEAVRYSPEEQAIWINEIQFFKPVPQGVWDFHIGGYQVLDKYLKSRKGRKLSLDEINHVGAVADSLAFTIEQMAKIDEAYRAAFLEPGITVS